MTKDEFGRIANAIRTAYSNDKFLPNKEAIELWYQFFKDLPYEAVYTALMKWIATEKWIPSIAELRKNAFTVVNGELPTADDAWGKVLTAVRDHGIYDQKGAMDSLDDITRNVVRKIGFRNICLSENIGIERSNFLKMYEKQAENYMREGQIPSSVKALASSIQSKMIGVNPDRE